MPERIQRKRTKGWRMPVGAVYVGRPTRWGNPWTVAEWRALTMVERDRAWVTAWAHDMAATCFRSMLEERGGYPPGQPANDYPSDEEIRTFLAGQDLACWCRLDQPCHADVLLELANPGELPSEERAL